MPTNDGVPEIIKTMGSALALHAGFEKLNKSSGAKGKLPGKSGTGQGRKSKAKAKVTPKKEAACVGDLSLARPARVNLDYYYYYYYYYYYLLLTT